MGTILKHFVLVLGCAPEALAVLVRERSLPNYLIVGEYVVDETSVDSKPGSPDVPKWSGPSLFQGGEQWRGELGSRLAGLMHAQEAMQRCGSFISAGKFSWCRLAMPEVGAPSFKDQYGGVREYVVDSTMPWKLDKPVDSLLGLSYGIKGVDTWSEIMSSMYFVKTRLYECFDSGLAGPFHSDLHLGHDKKHPCDSRNCYSAEYEVRRMCLDDSTGLHQPFLAKNGKAYQTLAAPLAGQDRLSTFLKLDVEGSEWASLEWLLSDEEAIMKIRTLDLEVHLNKDATPERRVRPARETLIAHVDLIERLLDKFVVTGSTLESSLKHVQKEWIRHRKEDANYTQAETMIHTPDGLPMENFCISFMNRKLFGEEPTTTTTTTTF